MGCEVLTNGHSKLGYGYRNTITQPCDSIVPSYISRLNTCRISANYLEGSRKLPPRPACEEVSQFLEHLGCKSHWTLESWQNVAFHLSLDKSDAMHRDLVDDG